METQVTFTRPYLAEGRIYIPVSAYEDLYRQRLRELRREVLLPGFRPGQVPTDVIIGRYGEEVLSSILSEIFLNTLKSILQNRTILQLPYYERSPQNFQTKPPFVPYEYSFRVLVVPQEPLLTKPVRLIRYTYESQPDEVEYFQRYMCMAFGHLEPVEQLPSTPPTDRFILMRFHWQPHQGASPLTLSWNSLAMPFAWSYVAGRRLGEVFEVPPQTLVPYTDYIRLVYPDFSPLTVNRVELVLIGALYSTPLTLEALEERLKMNEIPPSERAEAWQKVFQYHIEKNLAQLNAKLQKALLLHAAEIWIPDELGRYLYVMYLTARSERNGSSIEYQAFREELEWEILFQNLVATEPSLEMKEEDLQEEVMKGLEALQEASPKVQELIQSLSSSDTALRQFMEGILQKSGHKIRRSLQERRLQQFLKERFGPPIEQPLSLKMLLLHTI
ncbi:MAG: trigger factor [Bacteroidia bacterium]|nr:trigger factor family protein [Bacteroidia bacterium]MDW8015010.1 trigger factor [Bacteroidia bacterium]